MRARATVYNYGVETDHTYFVGETGVWAHNFCADAAMGETTGPMDARLSQAGRPDASEFNLRGDTSLPPEIWERVGTDTQTLSALELAYANESMAAFEPDTARMEYIL